MANYRGDQIFATRATLAEYRNDPNPALLRALVSDLRLTGRLAQAEELERTGSTDVPAMSTTLKALRHDALFGFRD